MECDYADLNIIRDQIETMSKFNQIEILKIFSKNKNVLINENKYGIHINLSQVDKDTLDEIILYVKYVTTQELFLNSDEREKEKYKNTFFAKDNKDIVT